MSGLKRTMGSMLWARTERGLFAESALEVLAYALQRSPHLNQPRRLSTEQIQIILRQILNRIGHYSNFQKQDRTIC